MVSVSDSRERVVILPKAAQGGEEHRVSMTFSATDFEMENSDGQVFFIPAHESVTVLQLALAFAREHGPAAEPQP